MDKSNTFVLFSLQNMLQFDEMGYVFSGAKENGIGGREPTYYKNTKLKNPGVPYGKSSRRVSIMFAINMMNEALPPLIIGGTALFFFLLGPFNVLLGTSVYF